MTEHDSVRLRIDMSTAEARELSERLAEDDEFRDRLASDPRAVLFEYGVEASPGVIPSTIDLPSKEDARAMIEDAASGNFAAVQVGPQRLFPVWMIVFSFQSLGDEQS